MNEKTDRIRKAVTRLQEKLWNIVSMVEVEKGRQGQFTENRMREMLPSREEKTPLMRQN